MYNVVYDTWRGPNTYLAVNVDKKTAEKYLKEFKLRYENKDGTAKAYPNGKGYYPLSNPRVERM